VRNLQIELSIAEEDKAEFRLAIEDLEKKLQALEEQQFIDKLKIA